MKNKELTKRTLLFGANSLLITLVVLGIIGVINFMGTRYSHKFDLTRNKIHAFSDQSEKVLKNLKEDVNATFFGNFGAREQFRPILENYSQRSTKFKLETVNPDKEPLRVKQAGIKKANTLVLTYKGRTARVEDITEEKITNELMKLTKEGTVVVCSVSGHGEQSMTDQAPEAFLKIKDGMFEQGYDLKELSLAQESKIPSVCEAVIILGPNKGFFAPEIKALGEYLAQGGRLLVTIEAAVTQADHNVEFKELIKKWGVEIKNGLIIDPNSKVPSAALVVQMSKENAITKDFKDMVDIGFFPFSRPLELTSPAPEGLKSQWLAKTTPAAWGENDMASISKGQVQFNAGVDAQGPITIAAAVSGKKVGTTPSRETRIVVFGSAQFANNNFHRFGVNLDLVLNSISWLVEDESKISIRPKEEEKGIIELTRNQVIAIFVIAVIAVPVLISIAGIVIWIRRKKL